MSEKKTFKIDEILQWIEAFAPPETAETWDHVGLMLGDRKDRVSGIVLSLDADQRSCELCRATGAQLLITHHPLIFHPMTSVDYSHPSGRRVRDFIQNGITVYSAHTNLDKAKEGVNQALANILGIDHATALQDAPYGLLGSVEATSLQSFFQQVKTTLNAGPIITSGAAEDTVAKIFVCGGSFDSSLLPALVREKVDLVVTGEIGYHDRIDLLDFGIRVFAVGHDVSERVVLAPLAEKIRQNFSGLGVAVEPGFDYNSNVF